jgi:hypothetical protein
MKQTRVMLAGLVAAISLAACSRSGSAPIDLGSELDAATGDTSGLLPNRGGLQYVSAIERTPGAVPAAAAPVKRPTPTPRARPEPVKAPVTKAPAPVAEEVVVAPAPAPTPAPAAQPAPTAAPTPTPTPTPHRRGGYSNMGDIIRNAPFPINPLDGKRVTD